MLLEVTLTHYGIQFCTVPLRQLTHAMIRCRLTRVLFHSLHACPRCDGHIYTYAWQERDKEIKRLKLELQLARPEDKATIAAREKREAQVRAMHKRQASNSKKK